MMKFGEHMLWLHGIVVSHMVTCLYFFIHSLIYLTLLFSYSPGVTLVLEVSALRMSAVELLRMTVHLFKHHVGRKHIVSSNFL